MFFYCLIYTDLDTHIRYNMCATILQLTASSVAATVYLDNITYEITRSLHVNCVNII